MNEDTVDISFQNQYGDKYVAEAVSLGSVLAMIEAVRGTDPELADTLTSVAYSLQPCED